MCSKSDPCYGVYLFLLTLSFFCLCESDLVDVAGASNKVLKFSMSVFVFSI